jgi:hypothetical protein
VGEWVRVGVRVVRRETEKAFQVITADGRKEWLPRSQMAGPGNYHAGDRDVAMLVTEWIAKQKGLIDREPGEEG